MNVHGGERPARLNGSDDADLRIIGKQANPIVVLHPAHRAGVDLQWSSGLCAGRPRRHPPTARVAAGVGLDLRDSRHGHVRSPAGRCGSDASNLRHPSLAVGAPQQGIAVRRVETIPCPDASCARIAVCPSAITDPPLEALEALDHLRPSQPGR